MTQGPVETPRTDAAPHIDVAIAGGNHRCVFIDFARTLEREIASLQQQLATADQYAETQNGIIGEQALQLAAKSAIIKQVADNIASSPDRIVEESAAVGGALERLDAKSAEAARMREAEGRWRELDKFIEALEESLHRRHLDCPHYATPDSILLAVLNAVTDARAALTTAEGGKS